MTLPARAGCHALLHGTAPDSWIVPAVSSPDMCRADGKVGSAIDRLRRPARGNASSKRDYEKRKTSKERRRGKHTLEQLQ